MHDTASRRNLLTRVIVSETLLQVYSSTAQTPSVHDGYIMLCMAIFTDDGNTPHTCKYQQVHNNKMDSDACNVQVCGTQLTTTGVFGLSRVHVLLHYVLNSSVKCGLAMLQGVEEYIQPVLKSRPQPGI